jgi:large subunit ribosomal protein L18
MQNTAKLKKEKRVTKHKRVRAKISGTKERPRLSVFRSSAHIYAQAIDDEAQKTIVSASDLDIKSKIKKSDKSIEVAKILAEKLKKNNIETIVFDRGGFQYHGRIKILAEELRKLGIKF